jgi:capsular polysaccharide export protein
MRVITLEGPVLLLMGPIGTFFSRFSRFLLEKGIEVHKVMLPLHELGYPSKCLIHRFDRPASEFRDYVRGLYKEHRIKHVFMYGDFIDIHRIGIEEAKKMGIEAWVFELGYVRPHYVTLERDKVNARSHLNQPESFYRALPNPSYPPLRYKEKWLWRKWAMIPTFIQHSLVRYPLVSGDHKLQPKPSYVYYQLRGYFRYFLYQLTEYRLKSKLSKIKNQFLVFLQVSIDSQLTLASRYRSVEDFILELMCSFAANSPPDTVIVFKHHPRDRGYNNYKKFIQQQAAKLGLEKRVYYLHDAPLSQMYSNTVGAVTINSSAAISALRSNIPVKAMGQTFYNMEGLCSQKSLDHFWRNPGQVDSELFSRFFSYMITETQVNGSFHGHFPFEELFKMPSPGQHS